MDATSIFSITAKQEPQRPSGVKRPLPKPPQSDSQPESTPPPIAPISIRRATATVAATVDRPIDPPLLAILEAPLALGETAAAGFARKEHELGNAFAQLSILEARTLHARLANPKTGDALAERFSRLTSERRNRLLAFLGDARRRAAVACVQTRTSR
ncbi:MAG TPA: hypothetical protein VFQ53_37510 [Kofleriaceae bacterium]|nr:hypothetical protein [Kofleriaceae bacterium]